MEGQTGGPELSSVQQRHQPRPDMPRHPPPIVLSEEEKRILKQCQQESFFYACVPLIGAGLTLDVLAVRRGMLRPSLGRKIGVSLLAYFAGKAMYLNEYKNRVLEQAPDGELAARIRHMNEGKPYTYEPRAPAPVTSEQLEEKSARAPQLGEYSSSISFDSNPQAKGLEDIEQERKKSEREKETKKLSYDELRLKNRQRLEPSQPASPVSAPQSDPYTPPPERQVERKKPAFFADESQKKVKRNQYGDVIE